jgi:hypothetical protein
MGTESSFLGVKQQGSEADQSLVPRSRKCRSINHYPTCSVMHRANFSFTVFSCFYFMAGAQLKHQRDIYMQGKTMYKHFTYYTISKHNTSNITCRFHHKHQSWVKSIQLHFHKQGHLLNYFSNTSIPTKILYAGPARPILQTAQLQ